ncbi:MAG: translation initiation factor IF-5A [Candidatus Hadarchaeia archaeon]
MGRETLMVKDLDSGNYVIVNEEPCVVTKKSSSTPKSNGDNDKEKIYVEGIFDGQKRTFVKEIDDEVEVPLIERSDAEVLALLGNSAQLMDLNSYETFELSIPLELRGDLEEGDEIEYIQAMGRKKIERKKG